MQILTHLARRSWGPLGHLGLLPPDQDIGQIQPKILNSQEATKYKKYKPFIWNFHFNCFLKQNIAMHNASQHMTTINKFYNWKHYWKILFNQTCQTSQNFKYHKTVRLFKYSIQWTNRTTNTLKGNSNLTNGTF